jgi:CIC family chloride channel protein
MLLESLIALVPAMVTSLTAFAVHSVFLGASMFILLLHREGLSIPENNYAAAENLVDK